MKKTLIILCAVLISFASQASDGLKLVAVSQDLASGKPAPSSTLYINATQMVMQTKQGGDFTILFDAEKQQITIIDHGKKSYSILGEAELTELSDGLKQMSGLIKAFYKNMPPETQKKFAPLVNGKDPNITFAAKGQSKVNTWPTSAYQVRGGDQKLLFDVDIADFSKFGVKQADVAAVKKLTKMLDEYLPGIESLIPGASVFANLNNDKNPMFTKGIPVRTVAYNENGRPDSQFLMKKVEKSNFKLSDFTIPTGYRRTAIKLDNPMGK